MSGGRASVDGIRWSNVRAGTYRTSWLSKIGWACWQLAVIWFFVSMSSHEAAMGRPPKLGAAFTTGLLFAFITTWMGCLARDMLGTAILDMRAWWKKRSEPIGRDPRGLQLLDDLVPRSAPLDGVPRIGEALGCVGRVERRR